MTQLRYIVMADAATRFTIDTKFSGRLSQLEPTEENIARSYEERKLAVYGPRKKFAENVC